MADEVDIEPEFEDEDDFIDRLSRKPDANTPDTAAPIGAPPVDQDVRLPLSMPRFTPRASNKKNQKDIEKAQRDAARRRKEEQAEARRTLREQQQEAARQQREAAREAQRQSREQITAARSEAISSRVQAYSLSASLGFPGYVAASVVDSLFVRPREQSIVDEQNQYQRDLQRYNEAKRREEIDIKRRQQQQIQNAPVTATALDDSGKPITPGTGGIPLNPPTPPGPKGPGRPTHPPLQRPTPPPNRAPSAIGGSLGSAATIVTAGIQVLQAVNGAVDKFAKNTTDLATSIVKGDATGATKSAMKTAQNIADPIGTNIPINVAVQSFDMLLETNKAILESTRQNLAFAPQSLQADVQGDISKLVQSIELTRKNDTVTAELIRANTQFELAWGEAKAKFIENVGPTLVRMLHILTRALELLGQLAEIAYIVSIHIPVIGKFIEAILSKMPNENKDLDDSDILNQINKFFDPDRTRQSMRKRNTFPNP